MGVRSLLGSPLAGHSTLISKAFRERVLSMPGKIAAMCEMRARGEVEEIVRSECYEALEELSRPIIPVEPGTLVERNQHRRE